MTSNPTDPQGAGDREAATVAPGETGTPRPVARVKDQLTYDETMDALCAQTDTALFFAEKGDGASTNAARRVCHKCPLGPRAFGGNDRCLEVALANREDGVWGATTLPQRRRILRKLREQVPA